MPRWFTTERVAPIIAGVAGMAWFWAELAPQSTAYPDTDDPAQGLAFITANPTAWPLAGLALGIAAVALVATVLALRVRLHAGQDGPRRASGADDASQVAVDTITVLGLFAAAMLFGMAAVRMSGGPVRYVHGLDQAWGEAAYLVTQFVGIQALVTGGLVLLELWLIGVAWLGARRGVVARVVAALAVLPGLRLVGVLGPFGIEFSGGWFVLFLAIPATFAWLVLLGLTVRTRAAMSTGDILTASTSAPEGRGHLGEASA